MKLAKKLIALALVLCMVFCLSVAVFADETTTPQYTDNGDEVIIKKTYRLIGEGTSPEETFKLEQTGARQLDGDTMDVPNLIGKMEGPEGNQVLVVGEVKFEAGDASTNGLTREIKIKIPAAEDFNVGKYEYTLSEIAGSNAGVTYYGKDIKLFITVVEENGHKRIAAVHTEDALPDGSYKDTSKVDDDNKPTSKKDTFENTYSAGKLNITKTVKGNLGDKDKYFKFTVTLTGEENKNTPATLDVSKTSYESNETSIKVGTAKDFYLKDGETLTISNLPKGMSYEVEEADYTGASEGYTTTVNEQEGRKLTGTMGTENVTAAFVNLKDGTIDTGVYMDSLPYILALAFAFGGAVVLFTRKRRVED